MAAEGPGASSIGHSTLEPTAGIQNNRTLPHFVSKFSSSCRKKKKNISSLVPHWKNDSSSHLRFDIYEDLPLSCVGFVEFHKGVDNAGEVGIFYSFSVKINTQRGSGSTHSPVQQQLHVTHASFCSLPALKFRVVDFTEFLLAGVGYSVSQKFNEIQSGFKTLFKRHVNVIQAAATDYRLTQMRKSN